MSTETLTVYPSAWEWEQVFNDEEFRDVAGGLFTRARTGNRWRLMLQFNNLTGARRQALWAHIAELRGRQNRLQVPLSLLRYVRGGAGGGAPLLVGAAVAGATSLAIDGASANITAWLRGGDFVMIGNELKIVTGTVNTSGSGTATIKIWPELHANRADNTAVNIATPHGVFFLVQAQGMGGLPHPSDWLNPTVTLVLEEDVYA